MRILRGICGICGRAGALDHFQELIGLDSLIKTEPKGLGQTVRERYERDFGGPFPLRDVVTLKAWDPFNWDRLHGMLDLYFGDVAGYACRADLLHRRPITQLVDARRYLSQGFFEKYPEFAHYRCHITPERTPDLFRDMATIEALRIDLLFVIDEVLEGPPA